LGRIETQNQDDAAQHDFTRAFFQNCWRLTDWIRDEASIAPAVKRAIQSAVQSSAALMLCSKLANGTKSLDIGNGATHDDVELARQCVLAWEEILIRHELSIVQA